MTLNEIARHACFDLTQRRRQGAVISGKHQQSTVDLYGPLSREDITCAMRTLADAIPVGAYLGDAPALPKHGEFEGAQATLETQGGVRYLTAMALDLEDPAGERKIRMHRFDVQYVAPPLEGTRKPF